jgi:hypothetical protein
MVSLMFPLPMHCRHYLYYYWRMHFQPQSMKSLQRGEMHLMPMV